MVFSSIIFLFLFLPVVLALYYGLLLLFGRGRRGLQIGNFVLLISSIIFYAWGEPRFVVLMLISATTDFLGGLLLTGAWRPGVPAMLEPATTRTRAQKIILVLTLSINLGLLAFFKYFNFGVENLGALLQFAGADPSGLARLAHVTLPLGISFYTFQSMSYTIDVYRGATRATRNPLNFLCYVTLFPQLVAGPIVRYRDVAEQLIQRRMSVPQFASGVRRFVIGLSKKVLIANAVAAPVDHIFALPADQIGPGLAWLGVICYALQIYFDFSGYSDMAIGLGRMFGFEFLENFNYPYISRSIREFWRRWHISLSGWFRDYLYIPLGGNRHGNARTYANLLLVFFLCGLWHGASWTFVVWGIYHGFFLVVERGRVGAWLERQVPAAQHIYALGVILGGWVIFRANSLSQAGQFAQAMLLLRDATALDAISPAAYISPHVLLAAICGALFSMPIRQWVSGRLEAWAEARGRFNAFGRAAMVVGELAIVGGMLFTCAVFLSSGSYNPFIYFRF